MRLRAFGRMDRICRIHGVRVEGLGQDGQDLQDSRDGVLACTESMGWRGWGGEMQDEALTRTIIGCAFKVHGTLKAGFSEKVYENALRIELLKQGLAVGRLGAALFIHDGHESGRGVGWQFLGDVNIQIIFLFRVDDLGLLTSCFDVAPITNLSAAFGVEGR